MAKSKTSNGVIITKLFVVIAVIITIALIESSCSQYDGREERPGDRWLFEIVEVAGFGTKEYMELWKFYWSGQAYVWEIPEEEDEDGWACLYVDRSELIVRRPIKEMILLKDDDECPWLEGDFAVEE